MKFCRAVTNLLFATYLVALALFLVSVFQLFGSDPDALSSVLLVLMAQPWISFLEFAPEALWPWLLAMLPLVNVGLLRLICLALPKTMTRI